MNMLILTDISYDLSNRCSTVTATTDAGLVSIVMQHDAWDENTGGLLPVLLAEHPRMAGGAIPAGESLVWNCDRRIWINLRSFSDIKEAKWKAIKKARTIAEYSGFTWDGSTFDSGPSSQPRISSAVQLAMLNPSFSVNWTLKDNTVRALSATDMVAVGMALGTHISVCHEKAQGLRAQIEAATTSLDVTTIVW